MKVGDKVALGAEGIACVEDDLKRTLTDDEKNAQGTVVRRGHTYWYVVMPFADHSGRTEWLFEERELVVVEGAQA